MAWLKASGIGDGMLVARLSPCLWRPSMKRYDAEVGLDPDSLVAKKNSGVGAWLLALAGSGSAAGHVYQPGHDRD